jgi:hypothetical protein
MRLMEIFESVSWIALGFLPTLLLLETYDRLRRGRKKSELKVGRVPPLVTG